MQKIFAQFPAIFRLAWPVSVSQMGYMSMILVDTVMVGRLGPEALGGVGIGSGYFFAAQAFFMGTLLGLDALVPNAFGRNDLKACHYWVVQAIYLAAILSIPLTALVFFGGEFLHWIGVTVEAERAGREYLRVMALGAAPFLFFVAFRQYLQAMNSVKPTTVIVILANLCNLGLNYLFIYGKFGAPALGVAGSALATSITRFAMAGMVIAFVVHRDRKHGLGLMQASWKPHWPGISRILTVGAPAGFQWAFEVIVFSLSTIFVGRLGAVPLAAHTVALNIASFTYMIPMAVASATSTRVGQETGEKNFSGATMAGWAGISFAASFMFLVSLLFVAFPQTIVTWFSPDDSVVGLAAKVLFFGALFQTADGLQTAATGALRGIADTRFSMFANLGGHWLFGLPIGYYFCFTANHGVVGLWWGLTTGTWIAALAVVLRWKFVNPASSPRI